MASHGTARHTLQADRGRSTVSQQPSSSTCNTTRGRCATGGYSDSESPSSQPRARLAPVTSPPLQMCPFEAVDLRPSHLPGDLPRKDDLPPLLALVGEALAAGSSSIGGGASSGTAAGSLVGSAGAGAGAAAGVVSGVGAAAGRGAGLVVFFGAPARGATFFRFSRQPVANSRDSGICCSSLASCAHQHTEPTPWSVARQ